MNSKTILSATLMLIAASGISAQEAPVNSSHLTVNGGRMTATMDIDLNALGLKSNSSALLTPMIIAQSGDSIKFPSIGVYGRKRRIHAERLRETLPATCFNTENHPGNYVFTSTPLEFTPALNGARPALRIDTYGCADCLKSTRLIEGTEWFMPEFDPAGAIVFEVPVEAVEKVRAASGRANVEFPVNRTELLTDFRSNSAELKAITDSIDAVKDDPDITITSIAVKGFASPEGSYANNRRLAEGRTEALRRWVEQRYNFKPGFILTAYEPEDWEGLRAAVEADLTIPYRGGLLEIINDSSLEPDARDRKLRTDYPEAYQRLLQEIYPTLRHTDYRIEYTVRSFTSPEEVFAVIEKNPSKLTASEFFLAAKTLDPEDPRYAEILTMAAYYDPKNEAANLNAASIAIKRGDYAAADSFLKHAGQSPAAVYTRGLLAMALKDYTRAEFFLNKAKEAGYDKAESLLEQIPALKQVN